MKKILTLSALLTSFSLADFVGGEINVGYYNHAPSGNANYEGDTIDVEDDLKWEEQNDLFLKAYIEHPIPVLPNIKVGYTDFGHGGSGSINRDFTWGDVNFNTETDIDTDLDLKMYDLALYYEILDNWLNADIGVNIKYLDGSIHVKGENRTTGIVEEENTDFALPIPMAYAKFRFDIPTTGISLQAEGNYITFDDHTLYDVEAGVRYTFAVGLGIEAGYKGLKLDINDVDNLSMDTDFSGVYGKAVWDF